MCGQAPSTYQATHWLSVPLLDSVVRPGLTYVYNLALMWLELDEPREVPSELAELSRVLHAREVLRRFPLQVIEYAGGRRCCDECSRR
jgi:hypothetical protein